MGEDSALVPAIVRDVAGPFARPLGIVMGGVAGEISALMTTVVDDLVSGAIGNPAGVAGEARQVLLRHVAGLGSAVAQIAREADERERAVRPPGFAAARTCLHTGRRLSAVALAAALAELVSEGAYTEPKALELAHMYLHDNAAKLYGGTK